MGVLPGPPTVALRPLVAQGTHLFLSAGRQPNTGILALGSVGMEAEEAATNAVRAAVKEG